MLLSVALTFAAELPLPTPSTPPPHGYAGTMVFPDARHRDAMTVEVAATGVGGLIQYQDYCLSPGCDSVGYEPVGAVGGRVAWTVVADLRLEVEAGYSPGGAWLGAGVLSWSAPVGDVVRFGAWFGTAGTAPAALARVDGALGGGAALSARWPALSLDVSVPLFVINDPGEETPFYLPWAMSEGSVSFTLGRGHSLRVGMLSLAPGVGWQWQAGKLVARADLHSVGVLTVARAELGARF